MKYVYRTQRKHDKDVPGKIQILRKPKRRKQHTKEKLNKFEKINGVKRIITRCHGEMTYAMYLDLSWVCSHMINSIFKLRLSPLSYDTMGKIERFPRWKFRMFIFLWNLSWETILNLTKTHDISMHVLNRASKLIRKFECYRQYRRRHVVTVCFEVFRLNVNVHVCH